jgi:hypothetical protein
MSENLENECRETIARHLKDIAVELVVALRALLAAGPSGDIVALKFEYESPHFDDGFPVMYWFKDSSGSPVAVHRLLPDLKSTIPEAVIYDPRYEAEDLDTWGIASEVFVEWFADCWEEAGGHRFCHPAHLAHHDSIYSFDLTRRVDVKQP